MTTICEPTLEDAKPLLEFDIAGRINLTDLGYFECHIEAQFGHEAIACRASPI